MRRDRDSTLIFPSESAKVLYKIELSSDNFAILAGVLAKNLALSAHVHIFQISVSDREGGRRSGGLRDGAIISCAPGKWIKISMIDQFVEIHNFFVGFANAGVEGQVIAMVKGSARAPTMDRAICACSIYHSFLDMYVALYKL
jgi:hypothetical protein